MNPDSQIAHYRVTARLGAGGMGEVFRARDTRLNREVAVKVLPRDFASDADRLRRFEQEAKTLAALNHPNVMTVFDAGQHEGAPYLVSELLEGRTLREELAAGALSTRKATDYALQMAQGLAAAHGRGVVHRDLKPDNVFVTKDGRVKILDFGLAKLREVATSADPDAPTLVHPAAETTEPGRVMGTPSYMAPEQVRGEAVDHRADLFAFGCVLYEMVSGQRPFRRDTSIATMAAILDDEPPDLTAAKPDLPPALARIVHRCLEKQPDNRFQSAKDLAFALSELAAGSSSFRSPTGESVAARPLGKRLAWPAIAAVLVVALTVVSVTWWRTARTPSRASQIRSLAVLPFKVNTTDPKLAGLEKWIPLEIVSKLGQVTNLQVVNLPTKIERLVAENKDVDEIARELQVDGLVRSELAGQGEAMTVYVTVVDSTGRAVGKPQNLPASVSKISLIPNQVAEAVVNGLNVQLSASQRAEIQAAGTQNAEAFLAYQKGRDLLSRRLNDQAAVEFRRAYQLDTNYTRAWTGLAESELLRLIYGGTTNEIVAIFRRLSGEAERFQAQRPDDPAPASLRMMIATLYERDWNKVRTIYWETQRNQKPDANLLNRMSWYYALIEGHPEQALHAREQVNALESEYLMSQINQAYQLLAFGRYDDAVRAFRSLPPEKIQLEDYSRVLLLAGDLAGAKEVAARVHAGRPNAWTRCSLAAIEAKSGAPDEARRILGELEADAEKGMHIPFVRIAWSYGVLGDFEAARRWLRKGLLEGHGDWTMLELRTAAHLEMFGKLAWYWEIVDEMKFPPLQMDHPYYALEQAMRYGRGTVDPALTNTSTNEPPRTLAVLPFANNSADKTDDSFSDGITEELITSLQKVKGLRVQGRMSSFHFKGKNETPQRVGEQLRVEHLLNGSVSRDGSRLRISADLVTAASGFSLWSTNYDRQLADTFAIRTEVAQQVALALKIQLGMEETRSLAQKPTANPEAHRLYLLGRHHFGKNTEANLTNAMQYFTQALQQDPTYALAYCGLANCYGWLGGGLMSGKEAWAKEKELAQKALALDPNLAEAHLSLGIALADAFDWNGGEREMKRALEMNPKLALAYDQLAWFQGKFGRFEEAIRNQRMAIELDPLSLMFNSALGGQLSFARRYDEARAQLRKTLELDPNFAYAHFQLGWNFLYEGDTAGAIAAFQKAKAMDPQPRFDGALAYAYARGGDRAKAEQMLRDWDDRAKQRYLSPRLRMLLHLGLGENDQALDWLERCYEERDAYCWRLKVDPAFDPVRTEPRFQALLKKVFPEP